jgi:hypothetical protein
MEFLRTTDPVNPAWSGCKTMHVHRHAGDATQNIANKRHKGHPRDSVHIATVLYSAAAVHHGRNLSRHRCLKNSQEVPSPQSLEEKVEKYPPHYLRESMAFNDAFKASWQT